MASECTPGVYDGRMSVEATGAYLKELRGELQGRLGVKVRELRGERGWTQQDLGDRIAEVLRLEEPARGQPFWTQAQAIYRLERGVLSVPLELIEVLARVFEVDPLLLIEPAFTAKPRNAEQLEEERIGQYLLQVMERYEKVFEADRLGRAFDALTRIGKRDPLAVDVAIRMLQGLAAISEQKGPVRPDLDEELLEAMKARPDTDEPYTPTPENDPTWFAFHPPPPPSATTSKTSATTSKTKSRP